MLPHQKHLYAAVKAFSLIEVVISIAIVSFAFIVIIALLPVGIKTNRDSMEESRAINLLQAMVADWQVTAFSTNSLPSCIYGLPSLTSMSTIRSGTNYVAEDGTTNSSSQNSFYRVTYTVYPNSAYMQPAIVNMQASWPAAATNGSSVEVSATFLP